MSSESSGNVTSAGRLLKRKVLLALTLSSLIPLLVLAYVVHRYVQPGLDPVQVARFYALQALILFTVLGMIGGAYIIWDLGRAFARMAELLSQEPKLAEIGSRSDEVGTLMKSFTNMLGTVEQQAIDINTFAMRLDAAYRELEATNAKLKETSFKDEVTGLYNRRFFSLRLEEEISRYRRFNHPVSVVVLDLDGFKTVNDEFGHAVGDETLRDISQILMKHSRGINVVSRYGGDEFVVLLVETSKAGARLYADRIRQVVSPIPSPTGSASRPASVSPACPTKKRRRQRTSCGPPTMPSTRPSGRARTRWPPPTLRRRCPDHRPSSDPDRRRRPSGSRSPRPDLPHRRLRVSASGRRQGRPGDLQGRPPSADRHRPQDARDGRRPAGGGGAEPRPGRGRDRPYRRARGPDGDREPQAGRLRLHHEAGERGGAADRIRPGARAAAAPDRAPAVPGAAGAARGRGDARRAARLPSAQGHLPRDARVTRRGARLARRRHRVALAPCPRLCDGHRPRPRRARGRAARPRARRGRG